MGGGEQRQTRPWDSASACVPAAHPLPGAAAAGQCAWPPGWLCRAFHGGLVPQAALAESSRLKEQLVVLQLKADLLGSVLGQERATALLEQVASSVRDRDLLHNSLLQRKSKLQVSPSRTARGLESPLPRSSLAAVARTFPNVPHNLRPLCINWVGFLHSPSNWFPSHLSVP